MKKHKKMIFIALLVVFVVWMVITNVSVKVTTYSVAFDRLPADPDMIAITGDLIDSTNTDIQAALSFVEEISGTALCYFVTGNHEAWVSDEQYQELEDGLIARGVTILRDEEIIIEKNGESISLIGVDDPDYASCTNGIALRMAPEDISELSSPDLFTILLSHRPEYYEAYRDSDVNLVLSGHAHGGQFRLPFVGGLAAPNQGLFPEYDSGVYRNGDFAMIVSRGIGNSVIPIRFNNQPEIVLVELTGKM